MNSSEAAAAITYTNGLDGRITVTEARQDLWAHALKHIPAWAVRAAILDYYATDLPNGARERRPIEPTDIRRHAKNHRPRCADHTEWPADNCHPCRDEIRDGNRPPELNGQKKHTPPANPGRIRELLQTAHNRA